MPESMVNKPGYKSGLSLGIFLKSKSVWVIDSMWHIYTTITFIGDRNSDQILYRIEKKRHLNQRLNRYGF